jgi:hypothetical protein
VAVLIWRRTRIRKQMQAIEARFSRIERQLSKTKNEIDAVLRIQVSLITRLNAQSKARLTTAAEMGVGDAELTISPPTVTCAAGAYRAVSAPAMSIERRRRRSRVRPCGKCRFSVRLARGCSVGRAPVPALGLPIAQAQARGSGPSWGTASAAEPSAPPRWTRQSFRTI